jgi:2-polyprenyl-3-methyl-5-hydroxy-6-metoxy-1,4-benzoquinol methylase
VSKATAAPAEEPVNVRPRDGSRLPSGRDLEELVADKYGRGATLGWAPRLRRRFGYFLPADMYEGAVSNAIVPGCSWLDVGGGHSMFPDNPRLARTLASRCSFLAAVDPSDNVHANDYAHERVQTVIERYHTERRFDVATLRMVAEHIEHPEPALEALHRLLKPGGTAVVLTVNLWSPVTIVSRFTPFALHHHVKRFFWGTAEQDTFPVHYKMNSRPTLRALFERHGFREQAFAYLDDLSISSRFRLLNTMELRLWRLFRAVNRTYPENCLLGIYQRLPD